MSRENEPITLDTEAAAMYIRTVTVFPQNVHTFELGQNVRLDVAGDGTVVGVEILNATTTVGAISRDSVARVSEAIRVAREDNL